MQLTDKTSLYHLGGLSQIVTRDIKQREEKISTLSSVIATKATREFKPSCVFFYIFIQMKKSIKDDSRVFVCVYLYI